MTEDLRSHLDAIQSWLDHVDQIPLPIPGPRGLSPEEKQQLQAVNKAAEQLTRLGVEIPADLRSLKLRLSANDVAVVSDPKTGRHLKAVEDLAEGLLTLLRAAKALRGKLRSGISEGEAPVRYGVTLKELIEAGLLSTEDRLELQWVREGEIYEGKLHNDGTLSAKTDQGWKQFNSLSMAAVDISGRNQNGWEHWRRVNANGTRTVLKDIRAKYLKQADES